MTLSVGKRLNSTKSNSTKSNSTKDQRGNKRAKKTASIRFPKTDKPKVMKNAMDKTIRRKISNYYITTKNIIANKLIKSLRNFTENEGWGKSFVLKFTYLMPCF